jgi:hypothetical protein
VNHVAGATCADAPIDTTTTASLTASSVLVGLVPGTVYCVRARGTDRAGHTTVLDTVFTTAVSLTTGAIVFTPVTNAGLSTLITSNTVTYTGTAPLMISGIINGTYQISGCLNTGYNTSGYVTGIQMIGQDCQITLQTTSSASNSTATTTILGFDDGSSTSWVVTTLAATPSSAGGGG